MLNYSRRTEELSLQPGLDFLQCSHLLQNILLRKMSELQFLMIYQLIVCAHDVVLDETATSKMPGNVIKHNPSSLCTHCCETHGQDQDRLERKKPREELSVQLQLLCLHLFRHVPQVLCSHVFTIETNLNVLFNAVMPNINNDSPVYISRN